MKLNNIAIIEPFELGISYIEIAKEGQVASGKTVKDIIRIKRIFSLPYKGLKPETMRVFLDVYKLGLIVLFEYEDLGEIETAYVTIKSLPRIIPKSHPHLSQNVTITLEEV